MSKRKAQRHKKQTNSSPNAEPTDNGMKVSPLQKGLLLVALLALAGVIMVSVLPRDFFASDSSTTSNKPATTPSDKPLPPQASFTGAAHCGQCHQNEVEDWQGSHHDLAMQPVNSETVLGDFSDTTFTADGVRSQFFRDGNDFKVRTDGPDGSLQTYTLRYTFGADPLQQYLVEFPGGRLQVLGIAWDSRAAGEGGQRWFQLYPDQGVNHEHRLHWTQRSQNWNFMCAECHSTHLEKNYNPVDDSYATTWSDIDVTCEACHGPASNHLLWSDPQQRAQYDFGDTLGLTHLFQERDGVKWQRSANNKPVRSHPLTTETEIQACAACHSRRSQPFEDDRTGQPLMDSFLPATLDEGLYHADGQVDDEVFVYGSFVQSLMYDKGVTCSDCHNPHSLELKADGNNLCLQCHEPVYGTPEHHFHEQNGEGSQCVDCHMPAKTFMQVDARRDHSFRIPRPDLSEALATPNACNQCHTEQDASWAKDKLQQWYGHLPQGHQQFAGILHAARQGEASVRDLTGLLGNPGQPDIARATAARLLAPQLTGEAVQALARALNNDNPQIRQAAITSLQPLPLNQRWPLLSPLLSNSHRVVRITAAEALADVPANEVPAALQRPLMNAFNEFEQAQTHNADTPGAQVKLGNFLLAQGYPDRAEQAYQQALKLDPHWTAAYVNMADLYRSHGNDEAGEQLLQQGLKLQPVQPDLLFALGLLKVRQQQYQAALPYLHDAAKGQPQNSRYQYVYAVALDSVGQRDKAVAWLKQARTSPEIEQLLAQWRG